MRRSVGWVVALPLALALAATASTLFQYPTALRAAASEQSAPALSVGGRTSTFQQSTITVKVAGGRGGTQVGPFANLNFVQSDRGKTLTVHVEQVATAGGDLLPATPVHLYRSLVGPVRPGQELIAFLDPPFRTVEEVAADKGGGTLAWAVDPGDYFVFFPRTKPVVRVPPETEPATVSYNIAVE